MTVQPAEAGGLCTVLAGTPSTAPKSVSNVAGSAAAAGPRIIVLACCGPADSVMLSQPLAA